MTTFRVELLQVPIRIRNQNMTTLVLQNDRPIAIFSDERSGDSYSRHLNKIEKQFMRKR